MRVYITRNIPQAPLERLQAAHEVRVWHDDVPPPRDVLLREAAQADALITMLTEKVDAELLDAAPTVKVIGNFAVGYDNIDVPAATARGIPIGNTPGVLTAATADLTMALLLASARRLSEGEAYIKAGEWRTWNPIQLLGHDLAGATLGILGMGRIGRAVAKRAAAFDMHIIYHGGDAKSEIDAEKVNFETLLQTSDFVSLHVPLTPKTRHLIGVQPLRLMKESAVLINTARGAVVDGDALYEALKNGSIARAALDVTDPEPLPADHPLLSLPNCLIVPHVGSATQQTRTQMGTLAVENVLAGLNGERLPHCVNPEVYEDNA